MTYCRINLPKPCDNHSDTVRHIIESFNRDFGGSTHYDAQGSWVNKSDNGKEETMYEPNIVIESYTDMSEEDAITYMKALGTVVKDRTNELSVMVVVNNDAYFV